MPKIIQLSHDFYVAPQISCQDIYGLIRDYSIQNIICNRPDTELSEDEDDFSTIEKFCQSQSLIANYQPIQRVSTKDILLFDDLIQGQPTLAYCYSGTRCAMLWAFSRVYIHQEDRDEIQSIINKAGFQFTIS